MTAPGAQSTISNTQQHAGRDANITTTNHNHYYGNNVYPGLDSLIHLRQHIALGALHDAAERPDPPRCHAETRTAIQDRIDRWARDKSAYARPILWLSGAAGAGKSAICQTLIERWLADQLVVPHFFLWRTAVKRNQKTHVMPTIAFQLVELLPETRPIIEEAVRDGSIFRRNLKAQVEKLIVNPIRRCQASTQTLVVVIDGLDECRVDLPRTDDFPGQTHEDQQRELLEAMAFASQELPSIRFLIASRPEPQIRKSFGGEPLTSLSIPLSLNHEQDTSADIRLYLDCKFADIRSAYPGRIPSSWPSKEQIDELIKKSSGQFIYPSTVVKHVSHLRRHPVTSLREVLALQPRSDNLGVHPLAELDALYTFVLGTVHKDSLPTVMVLLGQMLYLDDIDDMEGHPLRIFRDIRPGLKTGCMEKYLFLEDGELSICLTDLHSIISLRRNVEGGGEDEDEDEDGFFNIGFFHATLSEYLQDKLRSGEYFVSRDKTNLQILHLLLKHADIGFTSLPDRSIYDLEELYCAMGHWSDTCPPSRDLMRSIWSHFKHELGDYSTITGTDINSRMSQSSPYSDQSKYFQGEIAPYVKNSMGRSLLKYLQSCNISAFEPSRLHRRAIGAHLVYLLNTIEPGRYNDIQYVPSTEDLGDTEGSEEIVENEEFSLEAETQATPERPEDKPSSPREVDPDAPISPVPITGQTNGTRAKKQNKSQVRQFLSGLRTKLFLGRERSSS